MLGDRALLLPLHPEIPNRLREPKPGEGFLWCSLGEELKLVVLRAEGRQGADSVLISETFL